MTVTLEQIVYGDGNYITKLEGNRVIIQGALNELYGYLSGRGIDLRGPLCPDS